MQHYCAIFIAILIVVLSCSPVQNELWLESDGSGKMEVTFDLQGMLEMMGPMIGEIVTDSSSGNADPMDMFSSGEQVDTTVSFYDITPDSLKEDYADAELLKKMQIYMKIDSSEQVAMMKMIISFSSPEELSQIMRAVDNLEGQSENPLQGFGADQNMDSYVMQYELDLANGVIRLPAFNLDEEMKKDSSLIDLKPMLDSLDQLSKDSEEMALISMIFGSEFTTIVHAPGKITAVNVDNATINENTVTFQMNILEELKKEKNEDVIIRFNPDK
ncbi:MAG: hypothetical protein OEM26_21105 [Saprospiraceae bacterium]|nr:hypothetical protein [Saprospiraceae bacterium]